MEIEVERDYEYEGDFALHVIIDSDSTFDLDDLEKIKGFCDRAEINTDRERKAYLTLLFIPEKTEKKEGSEG